MAVKLRLARHGAKKRPYYRIVAANDAARRDGRFLELVGTYDPNANPPAVRLKRDRIQHWLDQGANPTVTVANLLTKYMAGEDTAPATTQRRAPAVAPAAAAAPATPAAPPAAE